MIEADAPSTEEVVCRLAERARPTGGSHGRTTRGPAQRVEGAKRRPRQGGVPKSAAKDSIKAGARKPRPDWPGLPARGCPYRRVLCVRTASESEGMLRCLGWCKAKAARKGKEKPRGQGQYRGRSPKAPARSSP